MLDSELEGLYYLLFPTLSSSFRNKLSRTTLESTPEHRNKSFEEQSYTTGESSGRGNEGKEQDSESQSGLAPIACFSKEAAKGVGDRAEADMRRAAQAPRNAVITTNPRVSFTDPLQVDTPRATHNRDGLGRGERAGEEERAGHDDDGFAATVRRKFDYEPKSLAAMTEQDSDSD